MKKNYINYEKTESRCLKKFKFKHDCKMSTIKDWITQLTIFVYLRTFSTICCCITTHKIYFIIHI